MARSLNIGGSTMSRLSGLLILFLIVALSPLLVSCDQSGSVQGIVNYKMVTAQKDRPTFTIVLNGPPGGEPAVIVNVSDKAIIKDFPPDPPDDNLVVDNSSLADIQKSYSKINYLVSIDVRSGEKHQYYLGCHTDQDTFNELKLGSRVKVEIVPSSTGPEIVSFTESN
jgi:hypothetical protein